MRRYNSMIHDYLYRRVRTRMFLGKIIGDGAIIEGPAAMSRLSSALSDHELVLDQEIWDLTQDVPILQT